MNTQREDAIYMAKILEQTGRYEDMAEQMQRVVELDPILSSDERNLLSVAFKNVVTYKRNGLRMLGAITDHEETGNNQARLGQLSQFREKLVADLVKVCVDLIGLVDRHLIPAATTPDSKVYYLKLKADYYRYICETQLESSRTEAVDNANKCYKEALDIANKDIPPTKPESLGLILNYSVFLFEILKQKREAIEMARKTIEDVAPKIQENTEESYQEANGIIQLLKDNIQLWSTSSD